MRAPGRWIVCVDRPDKTTQRLLTPEEKSTCKDADDKGQSQCRSHDTAPDSSLHFFRFSRAMLSARACDYGEEQNFRHQTDQPAARVCENQLQHQHSRTEDPEQ